MSHFKLHPNLASKPFILSLSLCQVLLEDNCHYPWIFLVPQRNNVARIMDLQASDQLQLLQELEIAQQVLWTLFQPTQLNVAAIGNKTPQLHIHIIARQTEDVCWPQTVWDKPFTSTYSPEEKRKVILQIKQNFEKIANFNK